MTAKIDPKDHLRIRELRYVTMLPGTWDKKFVMDMAKRLESDLSPLTERQSYQIERLAWKYRRRITASAVPRQEPVDPAKKRLTSREQINRELEKREKEACERKAKDPPPRGRS